MRVYDRPVPPNPTVAEAAAARGMDPVELILDLAIESDLRQLFIQPLTPMDDDELLAAMQHPRTVMTFSDAGAHVSQISDVSIQTHLLAYWVRQRGGVHPRGSGADDHAGARHGMGSSPIAGSCARASSPT